MFFRRAVSFVNARVVASEGEARSVRFTSRILGVDEAPHAGDRVIDLDGAFVLPGLINAHDHLELNHYGRLKFRDRYENVSGWIDDMRPRLQQDLRIRDGRAHTLHDRLFIGGLKNLLAGVTTVAHHNPLYRELRNGFPVRIVQPYGWAHSFDLEDRPAGARGEPGGGVAARYRATPPHVPFFLHLAEGLDRAAREELDRLDAAGCLGENAVLIHGVGIPPDDWPRVARRGAGLVWCPGSNLFLFGRTAPVGRFLRGPSSGTTARIALGTDSRLSGARDLLDELREAAGTQLASARELLMMVTSAAADLLWQPSAGRIRVGAPADLIVIPPQRPEPATALLAASRSDIRLVMIGGRPRIGAPALAGVFAARRVPARFIGVDGQRKLASAALVRGIDGCRITEPGVEAG